MVAPLLWHHMAEEGGSPQSRERPGGTRGRAPSWGRAAPGTQELCPPGLARREDRGRGMWALAQGALLPRINVPHRKRKLIYKVKSWNRSYWGKLTASGMNVQSCRRVQIHPKPHAPTIQQKNRQSNLLKYHGSNMQITVNILRASFWDSIAPCGVVIILN